MKILLRSFSKVGLADNQFPHYDKDIFYISLNEKTLNKTILNKQLLKVVFLLKKLYFHCFSWNFIALNSKT